MTLGLTILIVSPSRRRLDHLMEALAASAPEHRLIGRLDRAIDLPAWVAELEPDAIIMDTESPSRDTLEQVVVMSERIQPLLQLAQVRFEAWQAMREEALRARQELHEHKQIEQAKRYLMKMEDLSEEAAYQALRREAMTHRKRIADVARVVMELAKA